MSKYDFIKQGNLLFWHTADNDNVELSQLPKKWIVTASS